MNQWKKNKKAALLGTAAIVIALLVGIGISSNGIPVESAIVDDGQIIKLIKESGTVESQSTIIVAAKNSGEIDGIMVSEGDQVKSGDILMTNEGTSASLDIKSFQSELSGLQAQYTQARDLASKNKALYEQGALSYEEYNQSATISKQLGAQVAALNYSIKSYAESTGAAGVTAPIDGVITGVFIKEGETVITGAPLFEISNLNDIYIKVDLIAEDADLVKVGDSVRVYNEDAAFSDESCTVKKIHLKAQEKMSDLGINQKRVTVEIALSTTASIRLGSNVDVEIMIDKKDKVRKVSHMALFEMDEKDYVYVIENKKAVLREVKIGLEGEDDTEIISGLSQGEQVIISPNNDIEDGIKVKVE